MVFDPRDGNSLAGSVLSHYGFLSPTHLWSSGGKDTRSVLLVVTACAAPARDAAPPPRAVQATYQQMTGAACCRVYRRTETCKSDQGGQRLPGRPPPQRPPSPEEKLGKV